MPENHVAPLCPGICTERLRSKSPLVLCITNFVTANDCANLLLAAGASPVMALDQKDAAELARSADAVLLNTGTPTGDLLQTMLAAGHEANRRNIPLILDPAGVGASSVRSEICRELLAQLRFAAIRGNPAEMTFLAGLPFCGKGVDSASVAKETALSALRQIAVQYRCVAVASGATDFVTDGTALLQVAHGHPMMARITGTGCMSGALIAAMLAAVPESPLSAVHAAVLTMGIAGEKAFSRLLPGEGNASFRARLIDAVYGMTGTDFKE